MKDSGSITKRMATCFHARSARHATRRRLMVQASRAPGPQQPIAVSAFLFLAIGVLWAVLATAARGFSQILSGKAVEGGSWLVSSGLLLLLVFLSRNLHRIASLAYRLQLEYLTVLTLGYYALYTLAEQFRAFVSVFGFQYLTNVPLIIGLLGMLRCCCFIIFGFTLL